MSLNLDAAEAAVDVEYGSVHDLCPAQVYGRGSEADVNPEALHIFAGEAEVLVSETEIQMLAFSAILLEIREFAICLDDGSVFEVLAGHHLQSPYYHKHREEVFPHLGPFYVAAGAEQQVAVLWDEVLLCAGGKQCSGECGKYGSFLIWNLMC